MKKAIAVFLRPGSKWNPDKPVREQAFWDDHARFMDSLFEAGTVILGGPFGDGSGSMVILTAESEEAARAIFQDDPWAKQDVMTPGEVKEWSIFLMNREEIRMTSKPPFVPQPAVTPYLTVKGAASAIEFRGVKSLSTHLRTSAKRANYNFST